MQGTGSVNKAVKMKDKALALLEVTFIRGNLYYTIDPNHVIIIMRSTLKGKGLIFSVHLNYLGILLKCRFWLSLPGTEV